MTTTTAGGPRRTVAGGVLRIELPGAPLDAGLATAISELVPAADDLDAPAVVLLTTPPDGEFAGLGVEPAGGALAAGLRDGHPGGEVARCVAAVGAFPGVSVAALSGDARACGAELALACDLRVVWTGARIGFPHVRLGRMPACGATQRLPRLIGPGAALRLLLLGDEPKGEEMVALGLAATAAATPQATVAAAVELAERLAAQAASALRACKEAVLEGVDLTLRDGLRLEADLAVLLQTTHDRAEGLRAFLEKRPPRFEGR